MPPVKVAIQNPGAACTLTLSGGSAVMTDTSAEKCASSPASWAANSTLSSPDRTSRGRSKAGARAASAAPS
jgi:hypothetical protein